MRHHLRGKDLSKPILELMETLGAEDVKEMDELLKSYRAFEVSRLSEANKSATVITAFEDRCETLEVLMEGCRTRTEIQRKIKRIFEEKDPDGAVILSSAHSSKGLEAQTVYILRPDLMPHPAALKKGRADDIQQEMNLRYVAITRSMNKLVFIEGEDFKAAPLEAVESAPAVTMEAATLEASLDWRESARQRLKALEDEAPFDAPVEFFAALESARAALPR